MNRKMLMKAPRSITLALSLTTAAAFALSGCTSAGRESAEKMTSYTSANAGAEPALFTIPQDQMSHIQIVTITAEPLTRTLRLSGQVAYNGFKTTPVITGVGGPVSRVLAYPGQHVAAGDPLLDISSPDYSMLRANYLKSRVSFALADKNYARAQDLYAHHAVSEQDLLQAETNRIQAQADKTSSGEALRILGITNPESDRKSTRLNSSHPSTSYAVFCLKK